MVGNNNNIIEDGDVIEIAPKPKKKKLSLKTLASYKKKSSFFVLDNEALSKAFELHYMRFSNRFHCVEFKADRRTIGTSGKLAYVIAFGMVKSGGYLIIEESLLKLFNISSDAVEDGIAYIRK